MSDKGKKDFLEVDKKSKKLDKLSKDLDRYSRYFSIVTYCVDYDLKRILKEHDSSIRSWCYIKHDQDHSPAHFHLLIRLNSSWRAISILRWFDDLIDRDGKDVNTFIEVARSIDNLIPYILHDTSTARSNGKTPYDKSKLVFKDMQNLIQRKDSCDSSINILADLICGMSTINLVKKYGRDFAYHINHYLLLKEAVLAETGSLQVASDIINYERIQPDDINNL